MDLHPAAHEVIQRHRCPAQCRPGAAGLDAIFRAGRTEGQDLAQYPILPSRQGVLQLARRIRPRTMSRCRIGWFGRKAAVPKHHELRQIGVGICNRGYLPKSQLKQQALLHGSVGPLHTAFGLRRHGINQRDIQALRHPTELGLAVPALRVLGVDAEHPVPVGVECQRTAMRQNRIPQGLQIRTGRFRGYEPQPGQTARCVVDEHDQRAAGAARLEPRMRTPVYLHQFAEPGAPVSQLEHARGLAALRPVQFQADLGTANGLRRNRDALPFQQFLRHQGRTNPLIRAEKVFIQRRVEGGRQGAVRWVASFDGHQRHVSGQAPGMHHTLRLPRADPKPFGRDDLADLFGGNLTDKPGTLPLRKAHRYRRCHVPIPYAIRSQRGHL